jgi:hypothetical protein
MHKLVIITAMVAATITIVWLHPAKVPVTATASPISVHKMTESKGKPLPVEEWSPAY